MVENFEEDFPSLKDKTRLNGDCGIDDAEIIINIFDLKDNTLDKEKVKQAISKVIKHEVDMVEKQYSEEVKQAMYLLKRELRL